MKNAATTLNPDEIDCPEANDPQGIHLALHHLSCPSANGFRISRHDYAKKVLGETCKALLGAANVKVEHRFPDQDRTQYRPDLSGNVDGTEYYVDVTITNAGCHSNVLKGSNTTPLAAATYAENYKIDKYAPVLDRSHIPRHTFFAFGIEATGRFGNEATRFLRFIANASTIHHPDRKASSLKYCKRRIRYSVLKANADAKLAFLSSIKEYHVNNGISHIVSTNHSTIVEETKASA